MHPAPPAWLCSRLGSESGFHLRLPQLRGHARTATLQHLLDLDPNAQCESFPPTV